MKKEKTFKTKKDPFSITSTEYASLDTEEKKNWVPIKAKYERIPTICKIAFITVGFSILAYIIACTSPGFADFFNKYISQLFRAMLAKITNILPFSFAEMIVILLPIIAFISIWYLLKYRCNSKKSAYVSIICILSVLSTVLSTFILCFGIAYKGTTLNSKLDLVSEKIAPEELYNTADYLADRINELAPQILYGEDGFSVMPYSFNEMNKKLLKAYDSFCEKYSFINTFNSRLKPVMLSEPMSYTHITGVYTFFTGESNINVNFPDYTIPSTAAHELAHQRGIAREDEANMIAFLVCMESEDPYIRYSAYVSVYEYVSSALYKANKDLYKQVKSKLNTYMYKEQIAYSKFFDKYEKSVASVVTGTVNDVYLKTQGTVGKKSYGMVVDLTVAYFKKQGFIP